MGGNGSDDSGTPSQQSSSWETATEGSDGELDAGKLSAREARQTLYDIMRSDRTFESKAHDALELGRQYLSADNGHLARIDTETNNWRAEVSTDPPDGQFPVGLELSFDTTYCRRTIAADSPVVLDDAPNQGWEDDPAYQALGLHCYHGTTIEIDGEPYGTVCFVAEGPREEPFSEGETMFAELITQMLERELEQNNYEAELARQTNLAAVLNRILRHNLRNNLTVIRGFTEFMSSELDEDSYSETALRNVDNLIDLTEKARDLERVITSEYQRETVDISAFLDDITDILSHNYPSATIHVEGDEEISAAVLPSFATAIEELLENALKHSGENPIVSVAIEDVPHAVKISITDNGPGLSKNEVGILDTGTETPLSHGNGLGLWLANWIVTSHEGSLKAPNTTDGTTMELTIPRQPGMDVQEKLKRLTLTRDRYRSAFEEANDAMIILDDDGRMLDVNPVAADIFEHHRQSLLGRDIRDFLPESFDFSDEWQVFQEQGRVRDTVTVVGSDGYRRPVAYSGTAEVVPGEHLFVFRDISDFLDQKTELQETTQHLEAIIEASPDAIIALDTEGRIHLWNGAAEDLFGYSASEVMNQPILALELHSDEQKPRFESYLNRALEGETVSGLEVQRQTKSGEEVYLSLSTAPMRDASGSITGLVVDAKEITQHLES